MNTWMPSDTLPHGTFTQGAIVAGMRAVLVMTLAGMEGMRLGKVLIPTLLVLISERWIIGDHE